MLQPLTYGFCDEFYLKWSRFFLLVFIWLVKCLWLSAAPVFDYMTHILFFAFDTEIWFSMFCYTIVFLFFDVCTFKRFLSKRLMTILCCVVLWKLNFYLKQVCRLNCISLFLFCEENLELTPTWKNNNFERILNKFFLIWI